MFGKIGSQSEEILVFFLQDVHAENAGLTTISPNMFLIMK